MALPGTKTALAPHLSVSTPAFLSRLIDRSLAMLVCNLTYSCSEFIGEWQLCHLHSRWSQQSLCFQFQTGTASCQSSHLWQNSQWTVQTWLVRPRKRPDSFAFSSELELSVWTIFRKITSAVNHLKCLNGKMCSGSISLLTESFCWVSVSLSRCTNFLIYILW